MPVLTRLYSSGEFGVYATFLSLIGVLSVFSTFRYERGIVVVKDDVERKAICNLTLIISISSILIMYGVLYLWGGYGPVSESSLRKVIDKMPFLLALVIGLSGIETTLSFYTLKNQGYGVLGIAQTARAASQALIQATIAFSPFLLIENGLIIGATFAPIMVVIILVVNLRGKNQGKVPTSKIRVNDIIAAAKNNIIYPKYMVWSALCNSLTNHALVLMIGAMFSASAAGSIFLAYRVLMMPAKIIAKNISLVNLQEASELSGAQITDMYKRRVTLFLTIGLVPLLITLAVAPWLFELVFGAEWYEAGRIAQLLAPALYMQFVFTSFISIFTAVRAQKTYLAWSVSRLAFIVMGLGVGANIAGLYGAVIGFSASLIISYIIAHHLIAISLKRYSKRA